jgi:hypothetical protein
VTFLRQRIHSRKGTPARPERPASPPAREIFLAHYTRTGNEREARHAAGLSRRELELARLDDPAFDARCVELEEELTDKLEERLFVMARDDPATLRWALERLRPAKYGSRTRVDLNVRDVSQLSDEELEEYIAQCQGKLHRS